MWVPLSRQIVLYGIFIESYSPMYICGSTKFEFIVFCLAFSVLGLLSFSAHIHLIYLVTFITPMVVLRQKIIRVTVPFSK